MIKIKVSTYSILAALLLAGPSLSARKVSSRKATGNSVQVHIDISHSSPTFEADNPERIKELVEMAVCEFKSEEDQFKVFPIHANTGTSSPIVNRKGPKCLGSMVDYQIRKRWLEEMKPVMDKALNLSYPKAVGSQTNIYPLIRKIQRQIGDTRHLEVFIVSDMIHDYGDENLAIDLLGLTRAQVIDMANNKVQQLAIKGVFKGVTVNIRVPGTILGSSLQERIRENVDIYWRYFFKATGASVDIEML
jgi:hypothetical protein